MLDGAGASGGKRNSRSLRAGQGRQNEPVAATVPGVGRVRGLIQGPGSGAWRARGRLTASVDHADRHCGAGHHRTVCRARWTVASAGRYDHAVRRHWSTGHHGTGRQTSRGKSGCWHGAGRNAGCGVGGGLSRYVNLWLLGLRIDRRRIGRRVGILIGPVMGAADRGQAAGRDAGHEPTGSRFQQRDHASRASAAQPANVHADRLPLSRPTVGRGGRQCKARTALPPCRLIRFVRRARCWR